MGPARVIVSSIINGKVAQCDVIHYVLIRPVMNAFWSMGFVVLIRSQDLIGEISADLCGQI